MFISGHGGCFLFILIEAVKPLKAKRSVSIVLQMVRIHVAGRNALIHESLVDA